MYLGQSSGQRQGASGARSRSHLRTVSPLGYVRDSKYLQSWRIGMASSVAGRRAFASRPGVRIGQPTLPSICNSMRRLHSTAYSMGSVRVTGSMKPLTIMPMACSSVRPRLFR